MSTSGSGSENRSSSSVPKAFPIDCVAQNPEQMPIIPPAVLDPIVLEETQDFSMLVDIPSVAFDWEDPPQVLEVEQLNIVMRHAKDSNGTHQQSVALWAASAAATMALHHARTDAMIMDNEKLIKALAESNHSTAVEHAEHCRAVGTIVINLAEVAKIGADQAPTSALRAAPVQAAVQAKVAIQAAGNALITRGRCEIILETTKERYTAALLRFQDAEGVAVTAINTMATLERTNGEQITIEDESELGAVFDHDDVHGGFIDDGMNLMNLPDEPSGDLQIMPTQAPSTQAPEGQNSRPPTKDEARAALTDLSLILKPPRKTGARYKDPSLDLLLRNRLEAIKMLLWTYIDPVNGKPWPAASLHVAISLQCGEHYAKQLRKWAWAYIVDQKCLPDNLYGSWNKSLLEHEDLSQEIHLHLQGIGKHVRAQDIVDYLDRPEVKLHLRLKKTVSLITAQRSMASMGYQWTKVPSGQFVDGHERADVISYRQDIFLPAWAKLEPTMRVWKDGKQEVLIPADSDWPNDEDDGPQPFEVQSALWFHDESTYYANDR